MKIVEEIKDTARKATNSVIDTTEEVIGMPKSPKELAKRLIEHLNHHEYSKIAEIITDEAKKHVANMGLDDLNLVNNKLEHFKSSMNDLAKDFKGNYKQAAAKLKEFETSIPDHIGEASEIFKTIKSFLRKIIEAVETYAKEVAAAPTKKDADFSKLQNVFEEYFNKLTTCKK